MITAMKSLSTAFVLMTVASLMVSTGVASAQSAEELELRSTIRAAILSDSRSQTMTEAEVDAMVLALTRQAQSVGMTAEDIVWRPTDANTAEGEGTAGACDGFLCALNRAFGFDGSDYTIPIWLGASALMLILLIAGLLEYQHIHKKHLLARQQAGQQ
jgi:hypothetical protein